MSKPEEFLGQSDELLSNSYDMHMHAYPEWSLGVIVRYDNEEIARVSRNAGMAGIIFKSHFWPTMFMADVVNKKFTDEENNPNPNFKVYGSITLNDCCGGIQPWAVEAAIQMDARMVWMPTWSARNDIDGKRVSEYMESFLTTLHAYTNKQGSVLLGEDGKLLPNVLDVLAVCRDHNVALSTGHVSWKESLVLAKAAQEMGFKKLVFTHPDSNTIKANLDIIRQMADLGAYIEICALGLTSIYNRITPQKFGEIIHCVGADRCILSTDYFHEWVAPLPEQMRMLINSLLFADVSVDEVSRMCKGNPAYLLGL